MLLREAHCAIEEVSELVQDGAGFGNVDPLLRVDRSADAVDTELAAEICKVLRADHERPAVFVESVEDWLWNLAEFQQECVHIPLRQILHYNRRIGRRNGQRLRQDGMKKLRSFGAAHVSAYLAAIENETTAARMILTGRLAGLQPAVIRERLRETYA